MFYIITKGKWYVRIGYTIKLPSKPYLVWTEKLEEAGRFLEKEDAIRTIHHFNLMGCNIDTLKITYSLKRKTVS